MRLPTQTVIQTYQENLFRIAFSSCQNREDAEDVVQETFLRYHSNAMDFNDEMHIRAWLIRVTINQSKNMLRTFWHRNRTSLEDYMEQLNFPDPESQELFETVMKLPDWHPSSVCQMASVWQQPEVPGCIRYFLPQMARRSNTMQKTLPCLSVSNQPIRPMST